MSVSGHKNFGTWVLRPVLYIDVRWTKQIIEDLHSF